MEDRETYRTNRTWTQRTWNMDTEDMDTEDSHIAPAVDPECLLTELIT